MSSLWFSRILSIEKKFLAAASVPDFALANWQGIGLSVPPSYASPGCLMAALQKLSAFDQRVAHWPLLRGFADHRLFIFVRNS